MTVTQIAELSNKRCRIYLDDAPAFVLYKGELRRYHIAEGEKIDQEDYLVIMEEVLPKRAKLRAMNLLKSREYTTAKLREKLVQGFYPETVVEQALSYVASFHYIDDLRYAVSYLRCQAERKSKRQLEQDLLRRGIDKETLRKAWEQWDSEGGSLDEAAMIQKLLEKRHYDSRIADEKEKGRTMAFLFRKGFDAEQIRRALQIDTLPE